MAALARWCVRHRLVAVLLWLLALGGITAASFGAVVVIFQWGWGSELLGLGTGLPGLVLHADRAPLATTGEPLEVLLGVQTTGPVTGAAREYDGRTFEIWQRVETFAGLGSADRAYLLDPAAGTVPG